MFRLCICLVALLSACSSTIKVLDGATHACGNMHVEGYLTDSQGDIIIVKAPPEWTPEQVQAFCAQ